MSSRPPAKPAVTNSSSNNSLAVPGARPKGSKSKSTNLAKMSAELDSILDQALDDFEEGALSSKAREAVARPEEEQGRRDIAKERREKVLEVGKMVDSLQDPAYGEVLQSTLRSLSQTQGGNADVENLFENIAHKFDQEFKPGKGCVDIDLDRDIDADKDIDRDRDIY